MFANRTDAGHQLAKALVAYRGQQPLVLGLPRGGVVVGFEVTRSLEVDFDVVLVKKLGAPGNNELALGAIGEDGYAFLNTDVVRITGASTNFIESEQHLCLDEIAAQSHTYRQVKCKLPVPNRLVILVDDGLATGATMIAAVQTVALAKPQRLIVAVPVAPPETVKRLRSMLQVNDVVCVAIPANFEGVGQFYRDFTQVSDDEVLNLLEEFA